MKATENQVTKNATVDLRYVLRRADFSLDVDLRIPMQGITGIFGESGSGKTTLLRCIAGLEKPATGQLAINGDAWQDSTRKMSRAIHERQIGYVFQEPRLFRHLNVRRNLDYGRRRNRELQTGVEFDQIVDLLGLEQLLDRAPGELSGGEAQRVCLARTLLTEPAALLLDEPTSALDAHSRLAFERLVRQLADVGTAVVWVTHDLEQARRVGDRSIVLIEGRIRSEAEARAYRERVPELREEGVEDGSH